MKRLILSLCSFLLTLAASATTTQDVSFLQSDSIDFYGNHLAQLTQEVEVPVFNHSDASFQGHLFLQGQHMESGTLTTYKDTLITLEPYGSKNLRFYIELAEGHHTIQLAADSQGKQVLRSMDVNILPLRKLNFSAIFTLEMMGQTNGEDVLYGNSVRAWASVENMDLFYMGAHGGTADDDGIVLQLKDADTDQVLFSKHIAKRVEGGSWCKVEGTLNCDAPLRDGGHYVLRAAYGMPYGLEGIDSLCFTMRSGTNTYWTADGQVLPLPMGDDQQLKVPAEAVAVDLRKQHLLNTVFSIDASEANPNCLYYLDLLDNVPQGLDDSFNLVRQGEAAAIKLKEGHDYFCPLAFKAQFISYLMKPSYDNVDAELAGRGYSQTIVLPFHPSYACLYDINGPGQILNSNSLMAAPADSTGSSGQDNPDLHADLLHVLRYGGISGDTLVVSETTVRGMQAYAPYILGVYIGSSLLFVGQNTRVPMTTQAIERRQAFFFIGTTVARSLPVGTYVYRPEDNAFRSTVTESRIPPFQVYMVADEGEDPASSSIRITDASWGDRGNPNEATAISNLPAENMPKSDAGAVFDLSGRQIANAKAPLRSLPKGIYIIGKSKVVVK